MLFIKLIWNRINKLLVFLGYLSGEWGHLPMISSIRKWFVKTLPNVDYRGDFILFFVWLCWKTDVISRTKYMFHLCSNELYFSPAETFLVVNTSYNLSQHQWPRLLLPSQLWPISDLEAKWLSLLWLLITEDTKLKLRLSF